MLDKEQVLDAIRHMSVADLADLVRAIGVDLEAPERTAAVAAASPEEPARVIGGSGVPLNRNKEVAEGAMERGSVWPESWGVDRIAVIKAVREVTDLGLREARELVGGSPSDVAGQDPDEDGGLEPAGVPSVPKRPLPPGQAGAELTPPPCSTEPE